MKSPKLTKTELAVIDIVYVKKEVKKNISERTIAALISKGVIRGTLDLLSRNTTHVLTSAGKKIARNLAGVKTPAKKKDTMRLEVKKHEFTPVGLSLTCTICGKGAGHKIHFSKPVCGGILHGIDDGPERGKTIRVCFTEVAKRGDICPACTNDRTMWNKAFRILTEVVCPHCGGEKRSKFSVDQKCYHQLNEPLKHGLFRQHGEPENVWRHRYPKALAAALEFLSKIPTRKDIADQAKIPVSSQPGTQSK